MGSFHRFVIGIFQESESLFTILNGDLKLNGVVWGWLPFGQWCTSGDLMPYRIRDVLARQFLGSLLTPPGVLEVVIQ